MIADREEKGEEPPFTPVVPPPDPAVAENGAVLAPAQQSVTNLSPRNESVLLPQERRPPAPTASGRATGTAEGQPGKTNGKQRAPATATRPGVSGSESLPDDVGFLERGVKRDVDGPCGTATEGDQRAARRGAAGADFSREGSLT